AKVFSANKESFEFVKGMAADEKVAELVRSHLELDGALSPSGHVDVTLRLAEETIEPGDDLSVVGVSLRSGAEAVLAPPARPVYIAHKDLVELVREKKLAG